MTTFSSIVRPTLSLCTLGFVALMAPAIASAQQPAQESVTQADQNLAREQAKTRAAYASGNQDAIAKARASERSAYIQDWAAHHPRKTAGSPDAAALADQNLAREQANTRAAYGSGNKDAIAKARAGERGAYIKDWAADHPRKTDKADPGARQ